MAKSKKTGGKLSDRKGEKKFRSKWDKEKAKDSEDTRSADTDKEFSNAAGAGRVRSGTEDTEHDPQGYNEAMGADEYRKKGIYVTDSNHHGKDLPDAGKKYGDPDKGQHGHDCERVHPGKSHKAWEILNSTHDGGPAGGHEPGIKKNYESVSNENTNVLKFIGSISKKNYAQANKYLQLALEDKLKRRIASTANKTEF